MNAFDKFNQSCLNEASDVFGEESFSIDGIMLSGILNEYQASRTIEVDGIIIPIEATLVCKRSKFLSFGQPLEKKLAGKAVLMDGKKYQVETATVDKTSITLALSIHPENAGSS